MSHDSRLRVEQEIFLRSFFTDRPPERMARQLVARMQDGHYREGELLFERGAAASRFFFVVDGEVAMEHPNTAPWTFGPNSMIGVGDAILERPRDRTARALSSVQTLSISLEDYTECLEDNFEFAKAALERACWNIHEQGRQLAPDEVFDPLDLETPLAGMTMPQRRLNSVERLLALRAHRIFRETKVQPLVTLAQRTHEDRWEPGALVSRPDDPTLYLYVVVSGYFEITSVSLEIRAQFGPGSFLGGPGMLGYAQSPYRMQAKTASATLRIAKEDLFDVVEDHFFLSRAFFKWVARDNERTRVALALQGKRPTQTAEGRFTTPKAEESSSARLAEESAA